MVDKNNKQKLYEALSADYDMGSFEQFSTDLEDEAKRQKLYDAIKDEYELPDFNQFTEQLVGAKQQRETAAAKGDAEGASTFSEAEIKAETAAAEPQPVNDLPIPQAQGKSTSSTPTPGAWPYAGAHRMQDGYVVSNAPGRDTGWRLTNEVGTPRTWAENVEATKTDEQRTREQFGEYRSELVQDLLTDHAKTKAVPSERVVVDSEGNEVERYEVTPELSQEEAEYQARDDYYKKVKLDGERWAELEAARKQVYDEYNKELGKANKEISELYQYVDAGAPVDVYDKVSNRRDVKALQGALKYYDDALTMVKEARATNDSPNNFLGELAGLGRGLLDAGLDVSTWDMGMSDLDQGASTLSAILKLEAGKELTSAEQRLLAAAAANTYANSSLGEQMGTGYKAGQITMMSVPFMIEMALNPASGLGSAGSKALSKHLIKKYGREMIQKQLKKRLARQTMAAKWGTKVVGDAGSAGVMTLTSGTAMTAADAVDRMTGTIKPTEDEEGNIVYGGREDYEKSALTAGFKAVASGAIERHTEMVGGYIPAMKTAGVTFLGKVAKKTTNPRLRKIYREAEELLSGKAFGKWGEMVGKVADVTKLNDLAGEFFEEKIGEVENALLVGDMTFDTNSQTGIFNLDRNIETLVGLLPMQAFFGGMTALGYRTQKYRTNQALNKANKAAWETFGEDWIEMKDMIDGCETDKDLTKVVRGIISGGTTDLRSQAAVMQYVSAVQRQKGLQLVAETAPEIVAQAEAEDAAAAMPQPTEITGAADAAAMPQPTENGGAASQTAYDRGVAAAEADDYAAMSDIGYQADLADARIERMFDEAQRAEIAEAENTEGGLETWLESNRENLSAEQAFAVQSLIDANDAYDGLTETVRHRTASEKEAIRQEMQPLATADGRIVPLTLDNGQTVYLKSGDPTNRRSTVIAAYRDETGAVRNTQVSGMSITSIGTEQSLSDYTQEAMGNINYERQQRIKDAMDGKYHYQGEQVSLFTGDEQHDYEVTAVAPEGVTLRSKIDGSEMTMTTEELQDELAMSRQKRIENDLAAAAMPQPTENTEAAVTAAQPQLTEAAKEEERRKPLRARVAQWSQDIGADIEIHEDTNSITSSAVLNQINSGQGRVRGWYDNATGKVHVYMPGITDEHDIDETVIHEIVAHKGLRQLMGPRFDALCDKVYEMMSEDARKKYLAYPGVNGNTRAAADEYMAYLAENMENLTAEEQNVWQAIVAAVREFIKSVMTGSQMTDAQIEQLIRASYLNMKAQREQTTEAAADKQIEKRKENILSNIGERYLLSKETAPNGEMFMQNEARSTSLAEIPNEIFDKIGINPVPFKLTESMVWHVFNQHKKEAKFKTLDDAVDFILTTINNADHVRLGRNNSYIFSIENGRNRTGRRAITIIINSMDGSFMGIRTSGYENIKDLKERPLLWERSAETVPEDVATPTITTIEPLNSDEASSRTKSQSNEPSGSKDTDNASEMQERSVKSAENVSEVKREQTTEAAAEPQLAEKENLESQENAEKNVSLQTKEGRMGVVVRQKNSEARLAKAKEIYGSDPTTAPFFDDMDVPQTAEELVAMTLVPRSINWEGIDRGTQHIRGLQEEMGRNKKRGIGRNFDTYGFNPYLAKKGEGVGIEKLVEDIWRSEKNGMGEGNMLGDQRRFDEHEIKDALLSLLSGAQTSKDISDYVLNNRIAQAEAAIEYMEEEAAYEQELYEQERREDARLAGILELTEDDWLQMEAEYADKIAEIEAKEREQREIFQQILEQDHQQVEYYGRANQEEVASERGIRMAEESAERGTVGSAERGETVLRGTQDTREAGLSVGDAELSEGALGAQDGRDGRSEDVHTQEAERSDVGETEAVPQFTEELERQKAETNTNPTEAQKEAGNYKKGHLTFGGYKFTIESPKGSVRSGKNKKGKAWKVTMPVTYGYILGKKGKDGDHLDMFINDKADLSTWNGSVFVVDQINPETGKFDEHKIMYGFNDITDAIRAYLMSYTRPWRGMGNITEVSKEKFDEWVASSDRKLKPFAETRFGDKADVGTKVIRAAEERAGKRQEGETPEQDRDKQIEKAYKRGYNSYRQEQYTDETLLEMYASMSNEAIEADISKMERSIEEEKAYKDSEEYQERRSNESSDYTRAQTEGVAARAGKSVKALETKIAEAKRVLELRSMEERSAEEEEQVSFSIVTDPKKIAELEASPKRTGYRNVKLNEDGTFSSPMGYWLQSPKGGAKTRTKTDNFELGKWEEAQENPDLVDESNHIVLVKPDKGTVPVAYDPYIHNRLDPVNLQFKDAWKRDDLVYVETEVAETDLNSGYHADKALYPVGVHSWSNGDLMLSRYDKPIRILPWEEVADAWAERLNGEGVNFDRVPKALRPLLIERGVEILPPTKGMGKDCKDAYEDWKNKNSEKQGVRFSVRYDRSIPSSIDEAQERIANIIDISKEINNVVHRVAIAGITKKQLEDYNNLGLDINDKWVHSFENSRNIHNAKHRNEKKSGQIPVEEKDYLKIPEILESYDSVELSPNLNKQGNKVLVYKKKAEDGTVYYLEEVRTGRSSLAFETMYKKRSGDLDGLLKNNSTPSTSVTPSSNIASAGKDTQKNQNEQEKEGKILFSVKPLLGNKNLTKGLRELEDGETCQVERIFTENKNFEFSSVNKVESYDDIAYIFKQLEDEAVENSFAVLVKRGKPTVIHLGMGNYTATMVNQGVLNVAVNRVKPDKIYFVHNHPSGQLKASNEDIRIWQNLWEQYGSKLANGIIINTRSGKYGIFNDERSFDIATPSTSDADSKPLKVYSFNKQVFSKDYKPEGQIFSSEDVAKFVSSHRLGDRQKLGLILTNNKEITGNIFLPYSEITTYNARAIANDIIYYTSVMGGTRAFMFGNVPLKDIRQKGISDLVSEFSGLRLLDYIEIDGGRYKSAADEGVRFSVVDDGTAAMPQYTEEEQGIVDEAKKNGTWMKAPNGKATNLTEKQWAQVRTKAFKKWFGDWEKVLRIEKLRKSKPVDIVFNGEYELNRDSAKQWMKDNLRGEYVNEATGEKITITKIGANKVTSHGERNEAHLKSIVAIPSLIEKSVFIEELLNEKENDKYDSYRYYVCGAQIDGIDYTIKVVVGVKGDVKYYDHRLTQIEKGTLIDNLNGMANSVAENQNADISVGKDTKLLSILQTNSSKIVDENGEPRVVYHGTMHHNFTVFKNNGSGIYFTPDKDAADYGLDADPYAVFINMREPLNLDFEGDVDNEATENHDSLENEYKNAIAEGYDGVVAENTFDGENEMTQIVVHRSNQIKSATDNVGTFDEGNDDIRFSVKGKNANNLVVMHNISEGDLRKVLETGGLIMPSIAITDVNIGFSGFGDISLLFDKETINPSDRRNKVYGGDAWTPRFPQLVPKLNKEKVKPVADKLYELLSKDLQDYFGLSSEVHSENIEDNIIRGGIASYYSKDFMKIAYLLGNGKKFKVPMKLKPYGKLSEIIIRLAKEKGVSLDDINNASYEFYENNPDFVDAIKLADAEARTQNLSSEVREKVRDMILGKPMHFSSFDRAISAARSMEYDLNNGGLKQVVDGEALYEAINKKVKTDNADYNKWVDDLFDGIVEKYGIRNNKDWYTPSGNRRSWEQLYDAATPSNILRYMITQNTQGGSGGLFDSSIFGASAEEYKSIEEIRERGKKRLHKEESDDYDEWIESVTSRISDIKNEFLTPSERNDFRSSADANDAIVRAVAKDKTAKGIYSIMKRDYRNFTMEHAKMVADIVKEIQDKSVTYFEAKPQRIVPLSEIRKAIVPSNVDSDIIEGLQKNGIEVATYRRGNENARNRLIKKESNEIRFSFIGEQGASNLDKAEEATTRLDNLNVAREMEESGKDAKSIKMATGWERGADKKWRYEVDDKMEGLPSPMDKLETLYKEYKAAEKSFDRLMETSNRLPRLPRTATEEQKAKRKEFDNRLKEARKTWSVKREVFMEADNRRNFTLEEILGADHELFAAYPQLKASEVSFMDKSDYAGYSGAYMPESGNFWISPTADNPMSTLTHEIQHAIQHIEGFAQGGNTRSVQTKAETLKKDVQPLYEMIHDTPEWAEYKMLVNDYFDEYGKDQPNYDKIAEIESRLNEIEDSGVLKEIESKRKELKRKYGADATVTKILNGPFSSFDEIWEQLPSGFYDKFDAYYRLGGEVEARNAAERMGMTAEERRASLASETEDVAREDQVFIFDGLESAAMPQSTKLSASNKAVAMYDKANGTNVKGFFNYLRNNKQAKKGEPTSFHIGNAGSLLEQYGIKGKFMVGQFTFSKEHTDNEDHHLSVNDWVNVINNLNNPLAITSYKGMPNQYRIYTYAMINGKNICVGVNVSLADGEISLSRIISAYGRDINKLLGKEKTNLIYPDIEELKRRISQGSTGHDSPLNATSTASGDKGTKKDLDLQGNEGKVSFSVRDWRKEIRDAAEANGTWLKAPNGKPTNLTQNGWLTVRSGEFKKWLGDWELGGSNFKKVLDENGEPQDWVLIAYKLRPQRPARPKKAKGESQAVYFSRYRLWERAVDAFIPASHQYLFAVLNGRLGSDIVSNEESFIEKAQAKYEIDLAKWKEEQGIPDDATPEEEQPMPLPGERSLDYANRLTQWQRRQAAWKLAPKLENYIQAAKDDYLVYLTKYEVSKYPHSRASKIKLESAQLAKLRHAVARQKSYDQNTVQAVVDFAQQFLMQGFGDNISRGDIRHLLSAIRNATGVKDIKQNIDKIIDILVDNHIRNIENAIQKMASIKAHKMNAQNVSVQGKLELRGQRLIKAYNEARATNMTIEELESMLSSLTEKMTDADPDTAAMYSAEYDGYSLALMYAKDITESLKEYTLMRKELRDAESNRELTYREKAQLVEQLRASMLDNRVERIHRYSNFIDEFSRYLDESIEGAKGFNEAQKRHQAEIYNMAMDDLAGVSSGTDLVIDRKSESLITRLSNNPLTQFFSSPLATFEQILKLFGQKYADGRGRLYNYFMQKWAEATRNEWSGKQKQFEILDDKAREIFGGKVKRWADLYSIVGKMPGIEVSYLDVDGIRKTTKLTQGNLLYIYMANKMADGAIKLRKQGISESDMAVIEEKLDPRLKSLADWVQSDFFVESRKKYNKIHIRLFGAPMAEIENYVPIRILSDARYQEQDVARLNKDTLPSTVTGAIVNRRMNSLPLDIAGTDALSLVIEHVEEMEHWAAFAEFSKDISTLLSYTPFRNKVKNMQTIYGSGDALWDRVMEVSNLAAGTYRPVVKRNTIDNAIANISKGLTLAKVAFRINTALKQLVSAIGFLHDIDIYNLFQNPFKAWNWAIKSMPQFQERWLGRKAGDTRLEDSDLDWKQWRQKFIKMSAYYGMTPNAFVDAVVSSCGAYAVYKTKYKRYKKTGYDNEQAHQKALLDAEQSFNLTQQSSKGAYIATIQADRTVAASALSVFRNSSFSFTRQSLEAFRNLRRKIGRGYKEEAINHMKRQMMLDGIPEDKAEAAAKAEYSRSIRRDLIRIVVFSYMNTIAWQLAGYWSYLLFGDDDEEKEKALTDALIRGMLAGPIEGLAGGNILSDLIGISVSSEGLTTEGLKNYRFYGLPAFSDIQKMIETFEHDQIAGLQDVINLLVQIGVGTNPETLTNSVIALIDYCNGDLDSAFELGLLLLRLNQSSSKELDSYYIDALGMSSDEIKKADFDELAKRWATYKMRQNAPMTSWMYSDERESKKMESYMKAFDKKVQERMEGLTEEQFEKNYNRSESNAERLVAIKIGGDREGLKHASEMKNAHLASYLKKSTWDDIREDMEIEKKKRELAPVNKRLEELKDSGASPEALRLFVQEKNKELNLYKTIVKTLKDIRSDQKKMQNPVEQGPDELLNGIRQKRKELIEKFK